MQIAITFSDAFDHMYGEGEIMKQTFILEVPDQSVHPKCMELLMRLSPPKQYVTASLSFIQPELAALKANQEGRR